MRDPSVRARLDRLTFAEGLAAPDLDRLAGIAAPVQWEAGTIIFREGDVDPPPPLYVVEEGRVAIQVAVPGRGPVTILSVGAGEVFGWSGLFDRRPKSATARAIGPTRALAVDSDRLRGLCDEDVRFGYDITRRILRVVSERLKGARMQLLDVYR
jgi:CRP-like cAMP-binding protein